MSKDKCTFNKDNGAFIRYEKCVLLKRKRDTYQKGKGSYQKGKGALIRRERALIRIEDEPVLSK